MILLRKINQFVRLIHAWLIIRASNLFDKEYYLANNPDVALSGIDPLNHFIQFGGSERRDPGPYFSSAWYLTSNEDVKNSEINPLVHYLMFGKKEKRGIKPAEGLDQFAMIRSSGLFDEEFYLANNPDVAQAQIDPLEHYLYYGGFEGRDPGLKFSSNYYLNSYNDVRISGINPLVHYLIYGLPENRVIELSDQRFLNALKDYYFKGSKFSPLDIKQIKCYYPQTINWDGRSHNMVNREGKIWLIKDKMNKEMIKREILAFSLSKNLVNTCEIRTLTKEDCEVLIEQNLAPSYASPKNTMLIRLAQDYSLDDLPLKTLDSSLAGEFVFSLWIRRRDLTLNNHAYTKDGVLAFFDLNASLGFDINKECGHYDVNQFFQNISPGYAGYWRVRERRKELLDIVKMRQSNGYHYHFIDSRSDFIRSIDFIKEKILKQRDNFSDYIKKAGYSGDELNKLVSFLDKTTETLPTDVVRMVQVIFSEFPELS